MSDGSRRDFQQAHSSWVSTDIRQELAVVVGVLHPVASSFIHHDLKSLALCSNVRVVMRETLLSVISMLLKLRLAPHTAPWSTRIVSCRSTKDWRVSSGMTRPFPGYMCRHWARHHSRRSHPDEANRPLHPALSAVASAVIFFQHSGSRRKGRHLHEGPPGGAVPVASPTRYHPRFFPSWYPHSWSQNGR